MICRCTEEGNGAGSERAAKARTPKTDMEEAGGRECEENRVEDRGSCRSNEMEGRSQSDCGGDEVYSAPFGDEEKSGLKLDMMMMMMAELQTRKHLYSSSSFLKI